MTVGEWASVTTIAAVLVGGGGTVGKLYGDTVWVPIGAYQTEKLYDLQDEAADLEAKEKYEGDLTQREQEKLKRLLLRIERLEAEITK